MKAGPNYPEFESFHGSLSGASQAFKLGATDGQIYAVKFREKAQNERLGLARELLAYALAAPLSVHVPEARGVRLTQEYLDLEPRLVFSDGTRPGPGLASSSKFLPTAEHLPDAYEARLAICPPGDIAGVLAFNTWVGCGDRSWNNYAFTFDGAVPRFASIDYAAAFARAASDTPTIHDLSEVQEAAAASWPDVETALATVENGRRQGARRGDCVSSR